jgi:hypothetical protein
MERPSPIRSGNSLCLARIESPFETYFTDFRERHILAGYITVQDRLVQRIAALDGDVIHFSHKRRAKPVTSFQT